MREQELAVVRGAYEAFNAKDAEAAIAVYDAEAHFFPMLAGVAGGYHGHAGIRAWFAEMTETFTESTVAIEEVEFAEGVILVRATFRGRGRSSDAEIVQPLVHAVDIQDGLVRWFGAYRSREDALAGIRARGASST
jgi:ketosteroid isomerase-like protein